MTQKFEFGYTAKDMITGFTGVVTGWCRYITGCDTYCLTPPIKADGTKAEAMWFDENRIVQVDAPQIVVGTTSGANVSGAPSQADEIAPVY